MKNNEYRNARDRYKRQMQKAGLWTKEVAQRSTLGNILKTISSNKKVLGVINPHDATRKTIEYFGKKEKQYKSIAKDVKKTYGIGNGLALFSIVGNSKQTMTIDGIPYKVAEHNGSMFCINNGVLSKLTKDEQGKWAIDVDVDSVVY